jgi:hypothetical protein
MAQTPTTPRPQWGPNDLLDTKELAAYLVLDPRTLQRYRERNTGPAYAKFGTVIRYRFSDVQAWIYKQNKPAAPPVPPPPPR